MTRDDLVRQLQSESGVDWGDGNRISFPKGSVRRALLDALIASLSPKDLIAYGLETERTATSITLVFVVRGRVLRFHATWELLDDLSPHKVIITQCFIPIAGLIGEMETIAGGPGLTPEVVTLKLLERGVQEHVALSLTARAGKAIHIQRFMAAFASML